MVSALAFLACLSQPPRVVVATRSSSKPVAHLVLTGDELDPGLPSLAAALRAESAAGIKRVVALPGMVRLEAAEVEPLGVTVLAWSGQAETRLAEADDPLVQARWGSDLGRAGDPAWSFQSAWAPGASFVVVSETIPRVQWEEAVARVAWPWARLPRYRTFEPLSPQLPDGLAAVQWRSGPVKPGDSRFALTLVSMCALGSGPSGVLRKVCRDAHPWSYDQDAVLWPTRSGFVPVATVLWKADDQPAEETVQEALEAKVNSLTEQDLARAVRLAGWALAGDTRWSPLLIGPTEAFTETPEARVAWRGFLEAWEASETYPDQVVSELGSVTLPDLKRACGEVLKAANRRPLG